jgi:anti-anti-sigma factor
MQVKIDTKEKFHVITLNQSILTANLAADLAQIATKFLQEQIRNVVLKLDDVTTIDEPAAEELVKLQQSFYEQNASFVICGLQPETEAALDKLELLEMMNVTPTESEAWDIVQMEEIERELMDSEDAEFPSHND